MGSAFPPQTLPELFPGGDIWREPACSWRDDCIFPRFCGRAGRSCGGLPAPFDPDIVPVCLAGGGGRRFVGFASDPELGLSPALRSRSGLASALPGFRTMAVCGGTPELWLWGILWVGQGAGRAQVLLPHPLWHLVGLGPGALQRCWASACSHWDPEHPQQLCWHWQAVLDPHPGFCLPGLVLAPSHAPKQSLSTASSCFPLPGGRDSQQEGLC